MVMSALAEGWHSRETTLKPFAFRWAPTLPVPEKRSRANPLEPGTGTTTLDVPPTHHLHARWSFKCKGRMCGRLMYRRGDRYRYAMHMFRKQVLRRSSAEERTLRCRQLHSPRIQVRMKNECPKKVFPALHAPPGYEEPPRNCSWEHWTPPCAVRSIYPAP